MRGAPVQDAAALRQELERFAGSEAGADRGARPLTLCLRRASVQRSRTREPRLTGSGSMHTMSHDDSRDESSEEGQAVRQLTVRGFDAELSWSTALADWRARSEYR